MGESEELHHWLLKQGPYPKPQRVLALPVAIGFLNPLIIGIFIGALYALLSVGLTLIFGVMGVVNFAHGDFVMVAAYLGYMLYVRFRLDPYLSLLIVAPVLFLFGAITYYLAYRQVIGNMLTQFVLAIGLVYVLQNVVSLIFTAQIRAINLPYSAKALSVYDVIIPVTSILTMIAAVVALLCLQFLLFRTTFGTALRAVADDPRAASLMGISVDRAYLLTFGLASALGAVGGLSLITYSSITPTIGDSFVVIAFVVVVMGGLGNIKGTTAAAFLIGIMEGVGASYFMAYTDMIILAGFILTLLVRPYGILGRSARKL